MLQVQAEQNQMRSQLEKAEHQLVAVKKDKEDLQKKMQSAEHTLNTHNTTVANYELKIEKMQKEKASALTIPISFEISIFSQRYIMVPTLTGQMKEHFPAREFLTKYWKGQGILDNFYFYFFDNF